MEITILTDRASLCRQLLTIELAGRTCYQSYHGKEITQESAKSFIGMLLRRGHESVIEHSLMTVRFSDVSRGFTHELVRHRLCAFSQESTRYCDERDFEMVLPPDKVDSDVVVVPVAGEEPLRIPASKAVDLYRSLYRGLRESGWKAEDVRQFLPIGIANEIVVSANFREWRHIFRMRTQKAAHWEIRLGMARLLEMVREDLSPIFDCFVLAGKDSKGIPHYKDAG